MWSIGDLEDFTLPNEFKFSFDTNRHALARTVIVVCEHQSWIAGLSPAQLRLSTELPAISRITPRRGSWKWNPGFHISDPYPKIQTSQPKMRWDGRFQGCTTSGIRYRFEQTKQNGLLKVPSGHPNFEFSLVQVFESNYLLMIYCTIFNISIRYAWPAFLFLRLM